MGNQTTKIVHVITDDKGELYKVTTNIVGQRVRKAFSPGRVMVWLIVTIGGFSYIQKHTDGLATFGLSLVLLVVAYQLICKVIVSKEELETIRPLRKGEKAN